MSLNNLNKLLEPVGVLKKEFFWNSVEGIGMAGYFIFAFEIFQRIFHTLETRDEGTFESLIILYISVSIALIIMRAFLYKRGWTTIMYEGKKYYYQKYLEQFVASDGNAVEKIGTGRFITIIQRGVSDWLEALWEFSYSGVMNVILCIYGLYFIFTISDFWGWIGILTATLISIVAIPVNIWMREKRFRRHDAEKEGDHHTTVVLMSKNELLQNAGLSTLVAKMQESFTRAKISGYPVNIGFLILEDFPRLCFLFLRVGVYYSIGSELFRGGTGSIGDFAVFITVITVMEKSLNELFNSIRAFLRHLSGIELLWKTFGELPPIRNYEQGNAYIPEKKDIILKNISYGYNTTNIFSDFSLTIEKGKKTALVGPSGGGKTTLMKLIAGYLHPLGGSVSVFGNILEETALKTYYPHIGYLTQDPSVFDATIKENLISALPSLQRGISEGQRDFVSEKSAKDPQSSQSSDSPFTKELAETTEQKLREALRLAQCDFVFELEKGLDTEIGERGVRLSGGQKQRLAIAKIFLKDPEIILLDEPTSALDSFSEEKITEALDTLFEGRTVVIIAHRLQTVKKADDIIVIEGGKVVERGAHTSLVKKKGIYAKMLELQSGF